MLVVRDNVQYSKGFTLIEMLVVIAIIGIIASMLLGAIQNAHSAGRSASCSSNLRQIGIALNLYYDAYNNVGPLCSGVCKWDDPSTKRGWTEQMAQQLGGNREIFACPDFELSKYGYFLGVKAAHVRAGGEAAVVRTAIQRPTAFVAGGDCNKVPGFTFDVEDCDPDDYTQNLIKSTIHNTQQNFLFADNHAKSFPDYDPKQMTYRYNIMHEWDNADGQ